MRIHLMTIVGGHCDLLPMMVEHYRQVGVESFVIHHHLTEAEDPSRETATRLMSNLGCDVVATTIGDWHTLKQARMWADTMRMYPDDWCILADQDELQTYPDDLKAILTYCDNKGYDCVSGALLDRLAADGGFPAATCDVSIWSQFPLACLLSYVVLGGRIHKIVAAKGRVAVMDGHHAAADCVPCPMQDVFVPVHHFKWTEGIVERLTRRSISYQAVGKPHWIESARFVQHVTTYGGRVHLSDPRLMVAHCERVYPYWQAFTHMVLHRHARTQPTFGY